MSDLLLSAVEKTVQEKSMTYSVPSFLTIARDLFEKSYVYWRAGKAWFMAEKIIKEDASAGNAFVYAAALHVVADYQPEVNYLVNVLLVAKCAQDMIHQNIQVYKAYQSLDTGMTRSYPRLVKNGYSNYITKMERIASRIGKLIKEIFELAMRGRQIQLIVSQDQTARYEAFVEMFANHADYKKQVTEDAQFLWNEIEKRKELIQTIYAKAGINVKWDDLMGIARKALETSSKHGSTVLNVAKETSSTFFEFGKFTAFRIVEEKESKSNCTVLSDPSGRFPAWTGEKVAILNPLAPPITNSARNIECC